MSQKRVIQTSMKQLICHSKEGDESEEDDPDFYETAHMPQ